MTSSLLKKTYGVNNRLPLGLSRYHAISLVSFAAVVWSYHAARSLLGENR